LEVISGFGVASPGADVHVRGVPCKGAILVVDDDRDIREALADCFEQLGCTVVTAADGHDALQVLERCPSPCFVLLDMNMPRLGGAGFARLLRANERRCALPLVTMSAGEDRLAPPADAHLRKPFEFDGLAPTIRRCCQDPASLRGVR
jgi:CheY-like chemotaxis protein